MLVRRETAADRTDVRAVHAAAFTRPDTPGIEPSEAWLVDALRADGDLIAGLSLVAEIDGEIVGHVCCSRARVGTRDGVVALGPLGVSPKRWGVGVGSALMHAVLAAADVLGVPAVVLLGDPRYFGRFGFVLADTHGISPTVPAWAPAFQLRPLSAYSPELRGTFHYAPAFERL
ncbi:GNAT family N-acetyltransferase [Amycolatopsis suaedae]|uniref:N-acetyltransferase n=1 Tax=Amycolatopsis suaedae TaxID=2510978 RepID=A0A4Q7J0N0_9PSEU|nr:N-acetyltransferase [Amycolatopsis suaedae]RZQ60901.1 N-acetyltransferase [Amycolatopsis suaedae]